MYKWCSAQVTADKVPDSPPAYRNFHTHKSRGERCVGDFSLLAYINFMGLLSLSLSLSILCCCFEAPPWRTAVSQTVPPEGGAEAPANTFTSEILQFLTAFFPPLPASKHTFADGEYEHICKYSH